MWQKRTGTWHDHVSSSPAFNLVREAVMVAAAIGPDDVVVDLGAGTGFLSLAAAPLAERVLAVDLAAEMLVALEANAASKGIRNVETRIADLATFDLPANSVDVVVTSYALHHLVDADKRALVNRTYRWLRPGGRIVIADMMFGRGTSRHDRQIIWSKMRRMIRHGPAGVWRIARNLIRFGLRRGTDLPVPAEFWVRELRLSGFAPVETCPIVAEAALVHGYRP